MQRTPPPEEKQFVAPSRSETDQDSDSCKVTRRRLKRMRSPDVDLNASITFKLNTFKHDFTEHITNLFATFQENQDKKLSAVMSNISDLKNEFKDLKLRQLDIENKISTLTEHYETSIIKSTELTGKLERMENIQKKDRETLILLEDRLEDLQRNSRKASIEIKNVPKRNKEDQADLTNMLLHLTKSIDCNISKTDIKDIYRVRETRNGQKNTPIIVEFPSVLIKTEFLKKAKNYNIKNKEKLRAKNLGYTKDEETHIFVSEHLTVKASRLFFLARDLAKSKGYKYCWTSHGRVYVRKTDNTPIIQVKSESQVQSLFQAD